MNERAADPSAGIGPRGPRALLRAARRERGWSQSQAARELARLSAAGTPAAGDAPGAEEADGGEKRGADRPAARAASLKTQLSRWENGHAEPDAAYRALLGALYDRDPRELGLGSATTDDRAVVPAAPVAELARALAEADALDEAGLDAWREQLDAAARLDRGFGTAGAGAVVATLLERTTTLLDHVVRPSRRRELAAVVAAAAVLAGVQADDRGDVSLAWSRFGAAERAAREADRPDLADRAAAERARLLVAAGRPELVAAALSEARGAWADLARTEADAALARTGPDEPDETGGTGGPSVQTAGARATVDTAYPVLPAEMTEIRHHRAVVQARDGDPRARTELARTVEDPGRPVRERVEAGAVLALVARQAGEPDAGATARAHVAALRAGSDRMIALLTGPDGNAAGSRDAARAQVRP